MKKFLVIAGLFFAMATASAQATLGKGNVQLNAGFGFSGWGIPVYAGIEAGLNEDITLGGEVSFRSYSADWAYRSYTHNIFGVMAVGNYHFNRIIPRLPSEVDVYAGLGLGYFISSSGSGYNGSSYSGVNARIHTGGRYFFTNNFGVNLEVGAEIGELNNGILKMGITYKF
ncbi:MAG: hypothetical protein Q3983_01785 [Capnocytophaga sp.]|nr:hypothetical protein [Capnocytophaga sp.]